MATRSGACGCCARDPPGGWAWVDEVDTPLGEARESYRVGLGPVSKPYAAWEVGEPVLVIDAAVRSGLAAAHPATRLWVRQIGTHAQSQPLDLGPIG